jgi:hypothetical protein
MRRRTRHESTDKRWQELGLRWEDDHCPHPNNLRAPRRPQVDIAPDGGNARASPKPRPRRELIRAVARAHRWKRLLDDARYRSAGELGEAEGFTRSFVNRLLRLTLLAPDIVEAIFEGKQPKGMQPQDLTRVLPSRWHEQRQLLCQGPPP